MAGPAPALDTIDVVVADDHAVVRDSLRLVLEAEADLAVVGEAGDLVETERALRAIRPGGAALWTRP